MSQDKKNQKLSHFFQLKHIYNLVVVTDIAI